MRFKGEAKRRPIGQSIPYLFDSLEVCFHMNDCVVTNANTCAPKLQYVNARNRQKKIFIPPNKSDNTKKDEKRSRFCT